MSQNNLTPKNIQHGCRLTKMQQQICEQWLDELRRLWNEALSYLLEVEENTVYNFADKCRYAVCKLSTEYRHYRWDDADGEPPINHYKVEESVDESRKKRTAGTYIFVPYTVCVAPKKPYAPICPIPQGHNHLDWTGSSGTFPEGFLRLDPSKLNRATGYAKLALLQKFTHKNCPHLKHIPANFIRGVLFSLATAWEKRFQRRDKYGRPGYPKFKSRKFPLTSLQYVDAVNLKREGDSLRFPVLGCVTARGISERFPVDIEIKVATLQKQPDGWYMIWNGWFPAIVAKPKNRSIAISFRQNNNLYVADNGYVMMPYQPPEQKLRRLERLRQILCGKQFLSKNWHRVKAKIAKYEHRLAMARRNHNHKISTFLVRKYDQLVVDNRKLGLIRKPEPIPVGVTPPRWAPNGATAVSEINQRKAHNAKGQFRNMVIEKSKTYQRAVRLAPVEPPSNTPS